MQTFTQNNKCIPHTLLEVNNKKAARFSPHDFYDVTTAVTCSYIIKRGAKNRKGLQAGTTYNPNKVSGISYAHTPYPDVLSEKIRTCQYLHMPHFMSTNIFLKNKKRGRLGEPTTLGASEILVNEDNAVLDKRLHHTEFIL